MLRLSNAWTSLATATTSFFFLFFSVLLACINVAAAADSSTFCLTAPAYLGATQKAQSTTTLHKSTTSTELEVVNVSIVYTVTRQVPDHTITEHTKLTTTKTVEEYFDTWTSTYYDGTWTESFPRPTITITLPSIPQEFINPRQTHTSSVPNWRDAGAELSDRSPQRKGHDTEQEADLEEEAETNKNNSDNAGDLLPPSTPTLHDTVVCNTIFYATRTLTLTSVTGIVNNGQPKRTIHVLMTHTETSTAFVTPPGTIETVTEQRHYRTYTTTFRVVTAGMVKELPP